MRAVRCILNEQDDVPGAHLIHRYMLAQFVLASFRHNIWMDVEYTYIGLLDVCMRSPFGNSGRGSMSTVSSGACPGSNWAKGLILEGTTENRPTAP